jgi:hypothetical protein
MTAFTKFSVWENETREFLASLTLVNEKETAASVTNWFYDKAILISQQAQEKTQQEFNKINQLAGGGKPEVPYQQIIENKKAGFNAIREAMLQEFAKDQYRQIEINENFAVYQQKAISNHEDFHRLQAEITTDLYKKMNENTMPLAAIMGCVRTQYTEAQSTQPALKDDIEGHLLLQDEYMKYLQAQKEKNIVSLANRNTVFGSAEEDRKTAAKNQTLAVANDGRSAKLN